MTIDAQNPVASALGRIAFLNANDTPIWGMPNHERVRRLADAAAKAGQRLADGRTLFVNLAYAFDPLIIKIILARPDTAILHGGDFIIGQLPDGTDLSRLGDDPAITVLAIEAGHKFYNEQLRKLEQPFITPLTPQTVRQIERQSYKGAYKGVTDLLTKYLWPELALVLTRFAARAGMSPNMVTAIGGTLCVAAVWLFAIGQFWTGIACAFGFMVLDTVDGKLARCTITSSKWGNVFDHGIDLIHPPFWWYAWGMGLLVYGRPLDPTLFYALMGLIVGGYVAGRLVEGAFIKAYGMDIHVWQPIDSWFRLVTARRNPNMVILVVALALGRPDTGLVALAIWTILSLLFHLVRLGQAYGQSKQGKEIVSWLRGK